MIYLGAKGRRRDERLKFRPPQPNSKGPQEHLILPQIQRAWVVAQRMGRFVRCFGGRNQQGLLSGEEEWVREMGHDTYTSLFGEKVNKLITN